jgi:hypothetical protein
MKNTVVLFTAGLLFAGCNLASMRDNFDKDEGKEVLAKAKFDRVLIDSTGELQVYASMNRSDELKNDEACLKFADPYKELYLMVFKESGTDFKAAMENNPELYSQYKNDDTALMAIYSKLVTESASKKLLNGRDSLQESKNLHGMLYRAYAVTGSYKRVPLFYLKGIYKSKRNFYQVVVWTLAGRRNLYEGVMKKMAESLQEENDSGTGPVSQ